MMEIRAPADVVRQQVTLILAQTPPAALAAKGATAKPMADTSTVAEMNLAVGWSCILRLLRMNHRQNGNVPLRRES
jgi:hypothetical protein